MSNPFIVSSPGFTATAFSLTIRVGLALLSLATSVQRVDAAPRPPTHGTFSQADKEAARREAAESTDALGPRSECHRTADDILMDSRAESLRSSNDDDATHYCRGLTLVINLFIDHAGGTWSSSEILTAAARNSIAKDYFIDNAPTIANVHFDNEGLTSYWAYSATVPDNLDDDSDFTSDTIEAALANVGFTDVDGDGTRIDDATYWLKAWNGGWDNVILVAQPADLFGRASASYEYAYTRIFTDDTANVRAHEWGHIFGSCDEYVEDGMCGGGMNCGLCQSTYLTSPIANANCQLPSCPVDVPCLMINNTFTGICSNTLEHWGWTDDDADGELDLVKRRTSGSSFANIYELSTTEWILWNSVSHGFVYHQQTASWSVVGVRSPSTADYNLALYGENDHRLALATSTSVAQIVDFVVGDYNHSPISNEHVEVSRAVGAADDYRIQYESGTAILHPDGIPRNGQWDGTDVVRVWDVPLFAGEEVQFILDVTSGSSDLGFSLFKSNGGPYWAGRASAQWTVNANGAGEDESNTYTVPATDVYGLVIFSSNASGCLFTIQIGPPQVALVEETPTGSGLDLRLYNYNPNAASWAVVANRPAVGGNTTVRLFDDSYYEDHLETSSHFNGAAPSNIDFIAVDYNHASGSNDYVRVIDEVGSGIHTTEWEQDDDLIAGVMSTATWSSGHVCKAWDALLEGGASYTLRSYGSAIDQGIYFFSSEDGDNFKSRLWTSAGANFRPASNGEWVSFTAPATDWYGVVMIVNDEGSGIYQNVLGRKTILADDVVQAHDDQVQFSSTAVNVPFWHVWGVRPVSPTASTEVALYGDDGYSLATRRVIDTGSGVQFVVGDYNHTPLETIYPRALRGVGTGGMRVEMEGGSEGLVYSGGTPVSTVQDWPAGDVVEILDLYLSGSMSVRVRLNDGSGGMDLGMALFKSSGGTYYASPSSAVRSVDAAGVGGGEFFDYTTPVGGDWYGLVVYNKGESGGSYEIIVGSPTATDAAVVPGAADFTLASSPNPFREESEIVFALPREDHATLDVYDAAGRLVRRLVDGAVAAGRHEERWDGRDASGRRIGAGVYFARLESPQGTKVHKMIRVR